MPAGRVVTPSQPESAADAREPRLRKWRVPLAVAALGVVTVLPDLRRLGLWNDDVVQFLQPHHAAHGDALAFVLNDGTGFLLGAERPAGYLAYAVARLVYLAGVPWLHLFTVLAAALAAAAFARFHRHLIADEATALVAGALVLLWPLSPLTLFWPSVLHFTVAATLSILAAELALSARPRRAGLAGAVHLLASLTLEEFVFAAPAWTVAALASERLGLVARSEARRRGALRPLVTMLIGSAAVLAWRLILAPLWGLGRLHYERDLPSPAEALAQAAQAPVSLLWPWPRAFAMARQIWAAELPGYLPLALAAAATALAIVLGGARLGARGAAAGPERPPRRAWLALLPGAALLLWWTAQLAFVPGAFADPVGLSSRLVYPGKLGVAAALAGVYFLLCRTAPGRWRIAGQVAANALLLLALAAGGRFEARILRAHVRDWQVTASRMEQIASLCGSLAPRTLVVIDTAWPTALLRAGRVGMSHQVLSSLLIARYDDPTLRGVRLAELRAVRTGVRPLHFRAPVAWFRGADYGAIQTRARTIAPPVSMDRLVTLAPGPQGGLVAGRVLKVPLGHHRKMLLRHRPERCRAGPTPPSPAFCHAFPQLCGTVATTKRARPAAALDAQARGEAPPGRS